MTLPRLLGLVRKRLVAILVATIGCTLVAAVVSFGLLANEYAATTTLYVQASPSAEGATGTNLYTDLNASQMIANDVASLVRSDTVLAAAAARAGLDDADVASYRFDVSSETTSRVITLSVSGGDPAVCARLANAAAQSIGEVAREAMGVAGVNAIDAAAVPAEPSGPNRGLFVSLGVVLGLVGSLAAVVLLDVLNTKVRGADELERVLGVAVIGRIPTVRTEG